ncbi:sigma-70 family RNA polymerase sigma factor [Paenibacillus alginolyticus]|uniref:RNA polymerase sigma factor n=1 Tax=Paenibacillus alginolyticus TaxID=59839 RepID=UPI0003FEABB3|nr:sigma-70 family RNA polymerase sigma factor [Paenibacillus alginolyticus]MCY9666458.1 sigma-70 family RNA polymerase sigma factor [Paenibacillus alginolyticus]
MSQNNNDFSDIQEDFAKSNKVDPDSIDELFRYLTRMTKYFRNDISWADLDEVVQETLIKLWDMSVNNRIRTNIATVAPYIIRGVLRKKSFQPESESRKAAPLDKVAEGKIQGSVGGDDLTPALRRRRDREFALFHKAKNEVLSDQERELLYRRIDLGEEIQEIAKSWGQLPNTVSVKYKRAIEKVTKFVEQHYSEIDE